LAPHDISIILHLLEQSPLGVNCRGSAHVTPGVEDVTSMSLTFPKDCSAIIHSSWLDPRKVREMTIVGSKRMIVYDDVAQQEKIRIFDARVECPPHYDTFAEFHYAYHYGDTYSPYVRQEEPLKAECQHFLECIQEGKQPLTHGGQGMELVKILEASSASLRQGGSQVILRAEQEYKFNGNGHANGNGNGHSHIVPLHGHNGHGALKNGKFHLPVSTLEEEPLAV
jgi:predicted dehydrogenase